MNGDIFRIGDLNIEIIKPEKMIIPANFMKFAVSFVEGMQIQMKYHLEFTSEILNVAKEFAVKKVPGKSAVRDTLQVFQTTEGECRVIYLAGERMPYAVSIVTPSNECRIWVEENYQEWLKLDTVFLAMLSLEKLMIDHDAMILHSAYVCHDNKAILFSAPSRTGKSTQAQLWEEYRGTRTINGDRTLLKYRDDKWMAYAWPVCGSSGICHNENYPIKAIVMLKQANENKVYPLIGLRAVRQVLGQITVNGWDREFQINAIDNLDKLLKDVPVYQLECNISEDAVKCLETVIY